MTVKLCVNWSRMVYSPAGCLDLFLILGCVISNFLYLSFSTLYSSSLWRTDTIVFAKLNEPLLSNKPSVSLTSPPSKGFEMNISPLPPRGLIKDLPYSTYSRKYFKTCAKNRDTEQRNTLFTLLFLFIFCSIQ